MFDYHVHTSFSNDSTIAVEDALEKAMALGIKEIAFTDHVELNVWRPDDLIMDDLFDVDIYITKMEEIKVKYRDRIKVKIGVEMGLQVEEKDRIDQLVNGYPFDFVIGSSHTIDRHDLFFGHLFENKAKEEAYGRYFSEVFRIVREMDCYNVYGHLDLVRRYALGIYEIIDLDDRDKEMIQEIFRAMIEKERGIEVNTSGFRYGLSGTNPTREILEMYRGMGGEIITVGSDAHKLEHIGYGIKDAYAMLKEIGFKYVTVFNKRKPEFIRI